MTTLDVHLDIFEGPLDLLLYLIKKNNLDIYDIPISQITQEYLEYLEVMKELNLEVAGEFLVMASTLMHIKSRMLLPSQEYTGEGETGPDPRSELISKLEEHQKYQEISKILEKRFNAYKDIFYRGSPVFSDEDKFLEVDFFALIEAVKRAFERITDMVSVAGEDFPIESRIEKILSLLKTREWILLDEIFATETRKQGIITCFLALLELMKERKVMAVQDVPYGEVRIYPMPQSMSV